MVEVWVDLYLVVRGRDGETEGRRQGRSKGYVEFKKRDRKGKGERNRK